MALRRRRRRDGRLRSGITLLEDVLGNGSFLERQHSYPDRALLDQWLAHWVDLVDFEVVPVITSAEAAASVAPRL